MFVVSCVTLRKRLIQSRRDACLFLNRAVVTARIRLPGTWSDKASTRTQQGRVRVPTVSTDQDCRNKVRGVQVHTACMHLDESTQYRYRYALMWTVKPSCFFDAVRVWSPGRHEAFEGLRANRLLHTLRSGLACSDSSPYPKFYRLATFRMAG